MALGTLAALVALSLPPVAPVGIPGSGLTRVTGGSPFARGCLGPGAQRGSEVEPSIASGPGGLLAAAWQQDRYVGRAAAGIGMRVSRDGGGSWAVADVPGVTGCFGPRRPASDPWVSIGPDGRIWLAALRVRVGRDGALWSRVAISSSLDGGSRWSAPALLDAGGFNDKPSLTADPRRPGTAYAVWTRDGAPFLSRTVDGGAAWSPPRLVRRRARGGGTVASTVSVLPDGRCCTPTWHTGARGCGSRRRGRPTRARAGRRRSWRRAFRHAGSACCRRGGRRSGRSRCRAPGRR